MYSRSFPQGEKIVRKSCLLFKYLNDKAHLVDICDDIIEAAKWLKLRVSRHVSARGSANIRAVFLID